MAHKAHSETSFYLCRALECDLISQFLKRTKTNLRAHLCDQPFEKKKVSATLESPSRASLHSHTVEDLIRISIEGQVWKMLMLERVWPAGLAKAKDQEG